MKKVILTLLAVVIIFSECGTEQSPSLKYGIQPPIKGLTWGMSKEDLISAIGGEYEAQADEDGTEQLTFKNSVKAFGQEASVKVKLFHNRGTAVEIPFPGLAEYFLDRIILEYPEEAGKEVEKEIEKQYGPSVGEGWVKGTQTYSSKDTINDIQEEEIKKIVIGTEKMWFSDSIDKNKKEKLLSEPLNSLYTGNHCQMVDLFAMQMIPLVNAEKMSVKNKNETRESS